jgi:hypothetical protein
VAVPSRVTARPLRYVHANMSNLQRTLRLRYRRLNRLWHTRLKYHPYLMPMAVFLSMFFIAIFLFIFLNSQTVGASDSKIVEVFVDGKLQTIPTRAATVDDLLKRLDIQLNEQDIVEPARSTLIYDDFRINVYRARPITLLAGDERRTILTAQQSPRLIAQQSGISVHPEDNVVFTRPDDFLVEGVLGQEVRIERAVPMTINLYGNVLAIRTHGARRVQGTQRQDIAG